MAQAFNTEGLVRLQGYMGGKTLSDAQFFAVLNADVIEMVDGEESTTKRRYSRIAENAESVTFSCILGKSQQQLVLTKSSGELDVETSEISEGGGRAWTGHADVEGLKAIGWTDEDIAYYQEHGVNWNEEDDAYHLVPEDNKALYGAINIDNIQDYKDILVYLPKIDTTGVTSMASKFSNCYSLVAVPMMDASSVTNFGNAFQGCYSIVSIPLFDLSKAVTTFQMFFNCYSLVSVPLFNTSSVTSMDSMFNNCYSLVSIPLFDTSSVTNMSYMFNNCYSLVSIPLFDTSSVTNMPGMFRLCRSLISSVSFNTSNVDSFYQMYSGCSSIVSITLDMESDGSSSYIFQTCYSLRFCNIKNLKLSIDISATSLLEKSSLIYMIENAAPTDAITITLSAYCYNKFSNDPDVVSALSAQPLVSLASA